jgi:AcrR family transcriptional regulator
MAAALSAPEQAAATMAAVGEQECAPKRGRPRSAEVDETVLTKAVELLGEVGVSRMSMDELAERAKVSKATIYRRWPSKEQLVLDALASTMSPLKDVDTGSLRGDLTRYLGEIVQRFKTSSMSDVLPHLIEVACHDDKIRSSLDHYVQLRRMPMRSILDRAIARGEVPETIEKDVVIDAVIGAITYRRLLSHQPVTTRFVDTLIAVIFPDLS